MYNMKNPLSSFCFLTVICLPILFISCNKDAYEGLQENVSYIALAKYFQTMEDWETLSYTNLDEVDFSLIIDKEDLCPTEYYELINFDGYEEIQSFSKSLGFLNTSKLNDWFVEFGSVYSALEKAFEPDDETKFIKLVTEMQLDQFIGDCEMPIFTDLANKAFAKAKSFGKYRSDSGFESCKGEDLYGNNSSVHLVYKSLIAREECNR